MTADRPLVSTLEASRRLGIEPRAVYGLIEAGELEAYRTEHGIQVDEDAVARRAAPNGT
ncbi:MAG: hypothetical protein AB7H43_14085 [Acidimicrobiia bacterium]